jgi:CsoR family transcriptional regulator, copper-sensing transcriptional repressor
MRGVSGHRETGMLTGDPLYPCLVSALMLERPLGGIVSDQPGYVEDKDSHVKRLRRVEGQIRGLQRMVEDDKYCIDILTQVSAATKALQSVALGLLEEHMGSCVVDAARAGGPEADAKVKEAADAIARLVRS